MKMANAQGAEVYYNIVEKEGRVRFIVKGINGTMVLGRDRQRLKSRTFTQEAQAEGYLKRNGFTCV